MSSASDHCLPLSAVFLGPLVSPLLARLCFPLGLFSIGVFIVSVFASPWLGAQHAKDAMRLESWGLPSSRKIRQKAHFTNSLGSKSGERAFKVQEAGPGNSDPGISGQDPAPAPSPCPGGRRPPGGSSSRSCPRRWASPGVAPCALKGLKLPSSAARGPRCLAPGLNPSPALPSERQGFSSPSARLKSLLPS